MSIVTWLLSKRKRKKSKPIFRPHPDFFLPVLFPYCPKCSYDVSSKEEKCPNCGELLKWKNMPIDNEAVERHMCKRKDEVGSL